MEKPGLSTITVQNYLDSGNVGSALPEVRFFPSVRKICGLEKKNISAQAALTVSHYRSEFPNARSRARTMRMRQHD